MKPVLFRQRMVWWPTTTGWLTFLGAASVLISVFFFYGEAFLSRSRKVPADILLVEGWIGRESLPLAQHEFESGGYRYLVVTGGLTGHTWSQNRFSVTDYARKYLLMMGFPEDKLILAPCEDSDNQRTYTSAVAARDALKGNLQPKGINIISRGAHAARTYSVYRKVFDPSVAVGIISWDPYEGSQPAWWRSSSRAKELLDESFGYSYEAFFDSGRPGGIWRSGKFLLPVFCLAALGYWYRRRHRPGLTPAGP